MRHVLLMTALCAAATTLPGQAAAQGDVRIMRFNRPRLGVSVDMRPSATEDKIGARLREVMPDGPADKAGLKKGDIVTRFNGTALGGVSSEDDDESGPGAKLVELAQKLDDGDSAKVEYKRGSETRTATIVAKELSGLSMNRGPWQLEGPSAGQFKFRMPVSGEMPEPRSFMFNGPQGAANLLMRFNRGLNLIDLNADLGDYFGTKEGVLVVESPRDSTVPLKAGDVILSLDGRKPKSASHAQRILDSYDPGETIKADIMRKQKRTTVTWTAPEHRSGMMWKMDGGDDETPSRSKMRLREQSGRVETSPRPAAERS